MGLTSTTRREKCLAQGHNTVFPEHTWIQKVLSEGVQLRKLFLVDEGREDPHSTISGLSSASQRNAILMAFRWRVDDEMAFRWRADDGPTLNAGLVTL